MQLRMHQLRNSQKEQCNTEMERVAAPVPASAHYRWRVTIPDGSTFEVCCLPELAAVDMGELYPGTALEPLPESPGET